MALPVFVYYIATLNLPIKIPFTIPATIPPAASVVADVVRDFCGVKERKEEEKRGWREKRKVERAAAAKWRWAEVGKCRFGYIKLALNLDLGMVHMLSEPRLGWLTRGLKETTHSNTLIISVKVLQQCSSFIINLCNVKIGCESIGLPCTSYIIGIYALLNAYCWVSSSPLGHQLNMRSSNMWTFF